MYVPVSFPGALNMKYANEIVTKQTGKCVNGERASKRGGKFSTGVERAVPAEKTITSSARTSARD